MREKLKKIGAYIFRSWEDEPEPPSHPRIRILPPFMVELLSYLIIAGLLYQIGAYLWGLI